MGLEIFGNALADPTVRTYVITVIGVLIAFIALIIVRYAIRGAVRRKIGSIRDVSSMSMMDIEQMRKKGLINEQESRAIRQALAGSEVDRERRRQQAERERVLLAQVEKDPDVARLLLEDPPVGSRTTSSASVAVAHAPRTPASSPSSASRAGDLDLLLEKGAITPEEYQRLKSFFQ